jgi:hypothetical protein
LRYHLFVLLIFLFLFLLLTTLPFLSPAVVLSLLLPFLVPDVSLVSRLTMNLLSVAQTANFGCHVLFDIDYVSI